MSKVKMMGVLRNQRYSVSVADLNSCKVARKNSLNVIR